MTKTLIVGYGNYDRQDDGVAWHILARLAEGLERPVPAVPEDGFFPEGLEPDLWFVMQLAPEMAEDFAQYDRLCFVDAHTGNIEEEIRLQAVESSPAASAFTHHLTPAACLALAHTLYQAHPEAVLLSVRGYHFGFARTLSAETERLVDQAVAILRGWMEKQS